MLFSPPAGFSESPECSGVRRHVGVFGTLERASTVWLPRVLVNLARGSRVGGGQVRSSALGSSSSQPGSVQVVLPAAELLGIPAGQERGAKRAQLPPELRLPRRAPAAVRTPLASASCSLLRPPLPPPPPLGEDESGLHISTSELKGETEEGGGKQAFLRRQTLKAYRSQGSSRLPVEQRSVSIWCASFPPPGCLFYPLPNLKKKKIFAASNPITRILLTYSYNQGQDPGHSLLSDFV